MICNSFKRISLQTWADISQCRRIKYQIQEETITDKIALDLKTNNPDDVIMKAFSKREEGLNGADWEWWFWDVKRSLYLGFRVQAKIIDINTNKFEHLHYKNKSGVYQSEILLNKCLKSSPPRIPIYCLYLSWNENIFNPKWHCSSYPNIHDLYGCSLLSGTQVVDLRRNNRKSLNDIIYKIRPWHCLVCCQNYDRPNRLRGMQKYVIENLELEDGNENEPIDFVLKQPPYYVLRLIENKEIGNLLAEDEDLRGVIIFKILEE